MLIKQNEYKKRCNPRLILIYRKFPYYSFFTIERDERDETREK